MKYYVRSLLIASLLLFANNSHVFASHLFGADLYYTYQSGTTYTITMVLYGDCSGGAFPSLSSATPQVEIFDGISPIAIDTLTLIGLAPKTGTEVTPVCASQVSNTQCTNPSSSVIGIKKFTYSQSITLGKTSANWLFRFNGVTNLTPPPGTSAGRSTLISTINLTGGGIMSLEATLNNIGQSNSSPVYTTIPTPFFCINKPANFNPGTVDADNDSLVYRLVPGL